MKSLKRVFTRAGQLFLLLALGPVLVSGCGKSGGGTSGTTPNTTPKEAATQLQQAFASAPAEVKSAANAAAEALRGPDFDRAMQALEAVKAKKDLTVEQSMAIHESEAALKMRLAIAAEGGDANAKQALERLKKRHHD